MKLPRPFVAVALGLALLSVAPSLLRPGTMAGDGVDAWGTYWFYWWLRRCVEHGWNPSFTPLFFWPLGKDVLAHTGNNFVDAIWSLPFQWLLGPDRYYPVFVAVILVGNALSFRPLARDVLGEEKADLAALLWMVNPYVVFELTAGRPTQAFSWWVPLAILQFRKVCRGGGWRDAAALGVAVAVTGWTYWFSAFFLAVLLLVLAAFELRSRAALVRVIGAALLALVLVAPAVAAMATAWAQDRVPGEGTAAGSIFALPDTVANNVSNELHGLQLMETQGAPLFTQLAWAVPLLWAAYRVRWGRWWAAWGLLVLLGIGPALHVAGKTVVMPQYMVLYRHLPFFNRLWFPYRFASVAFVPATLLVVAALPVGRAGRLATAALVAVGLGGQAWYGTWPLPAKDVTCPPVLLSLREEPAAAVVFLPLRLQHEGLLWQTRFGLPTFGGMGESAPAMWPTGWRRQLDNPFVRALRGAAADATTPPFTPDDRAKVRALGFRWIVLRRDLVQGELERVGHGGSVDSAAAKTATVLGAPPAAVDGALLVWDLDGTWTPPEAWAATPEHLAAATWAAPAPPSWGSGLAAHGRLGQSPSADPAKPPSR